MDAAARRNGAGRIFPHRKTGARRASNAMRQGARRNRSVARTNTPRRRVRRTCRRCRAGRPAGQHGYAGGESGRADYEFGTQRRQLWTPQRGATASAASLRPGRLERDARATRCGKARGDITASCAATRRDAAGGGREEHVGRGNRPGSEALPAENREKGLRCWPAAWQLWTLRRGEVCGPRHCTLQDQRKAHAQRDVAKRTARSQRRAQQRTARPRATDASKTWGRAAGSEALPAENSGQQFAQLARGASNFGRSGAAQ